MTKRSILQWGFDLTNFGIPSHFQKVLRENRLQEFEMMQAGL
jgi:hypothetical protein